MPAPLYRSVPAYTTHNGDLAARVADQVGLPLDADQQAILESVFAEKAPDIPAARSVAVIAPRQGLGKTTLFEIAALTDVFLLGRERVLFSAHEFRTARRSFEHLVQLIDCVPDFRRRTLPPRATSGQEAIQLRSGARISFHARSKSALRGMSASTVQLDEALFLTDQEMGALLPVLATRGDAQVRYASSAGLPQSQVLRNVRDRGRAGTDRALAYWEWGTAPAACAARDCPHMPPGEVAGCALDDRSAWRRANPSLGRRISEEALEHFRREMAPLEFAREFLSHWDDPPDTAGSVIPADAWRECADRPEPMVGTVALGVAVAPDQSWGCVAAAGRRADGMLCVELVDNRPATAWMADRLAELTSRWQTSGVAVDPAGPAGALLDQLRQRSVRVTEVTARDRAQSCGEFLAAVKEGSLRHPADPALDMATRLARSRPSSDGFVVSQARSRGDVTPLLAVILAAGLFSQSAVATYDILQSVY